MRTQGSKAELVHLPQEGKTVLMYASEGGHTDVVELLTEKKANVNSLDKVCI